jgi:GNAT superfamily N-acetyltransferase
MPARIERGRTRSYDPEVVMGQSLQAETIRKLWPTDLQEFKAHLLRLDAASRDSRFAMAVSDGFLERYAETSFAPSAMTQGLVMFGHFSGDAMRGAAELRPIGRREAEAAFSVEPLCRGRGIGTALFERLIATARNRRIRRLYMSCLARNRAMQALARKFEAELVFEAQDVLGIVDGQPPSMASMVGEAVTDFTGYATAILDLQTRWFRLLPRRPAPHA